MNLGDYILGAWTDDPARPLLPELTHEQGHDGELRAGGRRRHHQLQERQGLLGANRVLVDVDTFVVLIMSSSCLAVSGMRVEAVLRVADGLGQVELAAGARQRRLLDKLPDRGRLGDGERRVDLDDLLARGPASCP